MEHIDTWGLKVINKAMEYVNYSWVPTNKNLFHGMDKDGRYVETPDVTWRGEILNCGWWKLYETNIGIPYSWGNGSTIEEFQVGIEEGKYAGNVPEDKKRLGSKYTVGVDCSGLLVCWELPRKISTRDIPEYANIIEDINDIRQGDVFAKIGSHVMFFDEFVNCSMNDVMIIDATRSTGKVSRRLQKVDELYKEGYVIYRKKS